MSTVARGNAAELLCIQQLESEGWVCGSRRHIGGPGDVVAVRPHDKGYIEVALIEVKRGRKPYENFRPADRMALFELAEEMMARAYLWWYPVGAKVAVVYHSSVWPEGKPVAV